MRLLARGGMAEVWEGRDDVLSRPIAVKMLLPHLAADPFLQERFRREAVAAARLVHPGIVAIFDAGVEVLGEEGVAAGAVLPSGWPPGPEAPPELTWPEKPTTAFIVMELVPGETLRDLMSRAGPLPVDLAMAITYQVADALAHAHAHGIVHRDIKPANVLLRDEGEGAFRVKVADFGIAKAVASTPGDLTANGTFLGTPKYVSPEQVEGKEPDGRADVYSLGVVLFEMLAGRPLFSEGSDMATALAHVQKAPPRLVDLRPDLPDGFSELVASLVIKDPSQRVGSALALCGSLNALRKRMGTPATEPGGSLQVGKAAWAMPTRNQAPGSGTAQPPAPSPAASRPAASSAVTAASLSAGQPAPTAGRSRIPNPVPAATAALSAGPAKDDRAKGAADQARQLPASARPSRPGLGRRRGRRNGRAAGIAVASLMVAGSAVALVVFRHQPLPAPTGARGGKSGQGAAQKSGQGTVPSTVPLPPTDKYPAIQVARVFELAQDGNQANDDLAGLPNVVNGNPHAFWASDQYHGPDFGGWGGLGLVLELPGSHVLHELVVTTPMQDWKAEAFVADSFGQTVGGWGAPTAELLNVSGNQRLSLGDRRGSWVLFWMLDPGPTERAVVDKLSVH